MTIERSPEYHEAHLAFAAAHIVGAAANREPILNLLRAYRADVEKATADQLAGAVSLLDALNPYTSHRLECGSLSGAPDCDCGFDDLYTRVRAAVRGQ